MTDLKAVAFDELIERDIMKGEGNAKMIAKLKRFVDVHGVSVVGLLQRLPHRTFSFPSFSCYDPLWIPMHSTASIFKSCKE